MHSQVYETYLFSLASKSHLFDRRHSKFKTWHLFLLYPFCTHVIEGYYLGSRSFPFLCIFAHNAPTFPFIHCCSRNVPLEPQENIYSSVATGNMSMGYFLLPWLVSLLNINFYLFLGYAFILPCSLLVQEVQSLSAFPSFVSKEKSCATCLSANIV